MKIDIEKKEGGKVIIKVEVSNEEASPFLDRAATRLAAKHQIPGFRPGKAPLSMIKSKLGEMAVYEEALQELISKTLVDAMKEHKIKSVGNPEIDMEKIAPGNPVIYRATVALMPEVNLNQWREVRVKKQLITITDEEVDSMVDELRNMQAKEAIVDREAKKGDKVEVNFEVKQDGVITEGGKGTKHPIIIGKGAMVPGFEDKIAGMKAKGQKDFKLTFPKPYFQEKLAGKEVDFHVEVVAVYERTLPEKNDEWAKGVLGKSYQEMLEMLRQNLKTEKEGKEQQRLEQEMFDKIIAQSIFSALPDVLLKAETSKMIHELEHDVSSRGMKWEEYLNSIKRTKEELEKEFGKQADKRVKSALTLRTLADELKVEVKDKELDEELVKQKEEYKQDEKAQEQMAVPEYRNYLRRIMINRKTLDNLVSLLVDTK